jgi:TRAP-type C4-dicarboxylate transport system permease small subunit
MIERLSHLLNRVAEHSIFGLGIGMAMIVAAQVFFRYVLNHSLFWSEELARYLMVWLTFLGAGVAYYRRVHPGIDVLTKRLSRRHQRRLEILIHAVSLSFFSILIVYGIRFAWFVRLQFSPALSIPKWIVFAVIPVSGAILAVHSLHLLVSTTGRGRA